MQSHNADAQTSPPDAGPGISPGHPRHRVSHRSCTECGRRKIGCDHCLPCIHCLNNGRECIYPTSRRPATKSKKAKARNDEVLGYLKKLEDRLTAKEKADGGASPTNESPLTNIAEPVITGDALAPVTVPTPQVNDLGPDDDGSPQLEVDQDRSRYISNNFWRTMAREIEEMRNTQDYSTPENDARNGQNVQDVYDPSPEPLRRETFMLSPFPGTQSLQSLHPNPSHVLDMFDLFQENVDPVVRVFHRPTLRQMVSGLLSHGPNAENKHADVVLFTIYYAAVTSIQDAECKQSFQEDRSVLLARYRYGIEQSLERAQFVSHPNFAVLSSLVVFLFCVRRHDSSLFVSNLLGLVVRIAQSMGLHRDGTNFKISPFQIEMRRRVWWQICVLDVRASEDHGSDPILYSYTYDTKFPLNINDDEISPESTEPPKPRTGASEMTFCLVRFEIVIVLRRLNYQAPGGPEGVLTRDESRRMVEALETKFEQNYIQYCDITKPFEWMAATWARLLLAKLWLSVYTKERTDDNGHGLPAIEKAIEVLETSDLLETAPRAARWRWMFLTHVQWPIVVFILAYLCAYPEAAMATRAREAIDRVHERWADSISAKQGMLWKPVRQLMRKAQQVREKALTQTHAKETPTEPIPHQATSILAGPRESLGPDVEITPSSNTQIDVMSRDGAFPNQPGWAGWDQVFHDLNHNFFDISALSEGEFPGRFQMYGGNFWETH